ncbi:MAG: type II toxin-antitoxin system VapC family toxin [Thermoanaerobaculales bacterium]|jgi:predicted nucleic acid-binding protein|nr:type II toxin-antitoxin system VapC family toxin [Thermoanaerobaculales bacterium]
MTSRGCVVDASVVVAALVSSDDAGRWAEEIVGGGHLAAPQLVIVETLNILRRMEASEQIAGLEAAAAQRNLHDLPIDLAPIRSFEERIWQLRANLTSYDAWYVAVAEVLGLPLATLDRRLAEAPGPTCAFAIPD